MGNRENIAIVWLKRDLRLHDNEAIFNGLLSGKRVLLLYVFEPSLLEDSHYDKRHFDFIKQSLEDINKFLKPYNTKVLTIQTEVISALSNLQNFFAIRELFSHQETGLMVTFKRDKNVKRFCNNNAIDWTENVSNGVFRARENRDNWVKDWETYMKTSPFVFHPKQDSFITIQEIEKLEQNFVIPSLKTKKSRVFQYGGRSTGLKYMDSFFKERYVNYARHISKPTKARESCSRLSPYLAWGNFSIREVFQYAKQFRPESKNKRAIDGFTTRLRWQAHFIQKFEMECIMEKESINKGYSKLKKSVSDEYQKAWREGKTGFPIIDACMRCVVTTGYLNFRMRAMVVSFFTHNLWQPWQDASKFLSKQFLDFEPGIHFPQLQMQAGEVGVNTIRIYNPIKNGLEHDADAEFIKKWVPELQNLPLAFIHEPYKMTYLDQKLSGFELGTDYPHPIIDIQKTRKKASDTIWEMRKDPDVQKESIRILNKHVIQRPTRKK